MCSDARPCHRDVVLYSLALAFYFWQLNLPVNNLKGVFIFGDYVSNINVIPKEFIL